MEDFDLILESGEKKFTYFFENSFKFFLKSFMAGCYLGIAMVLSLFLGSILNTFDANIAKIGYSMFFGLTFVLIVFLNGELFTGNCLTTSFPIFNRTRSITEMGKMWFICLIGNIVGVSWFLWLFVKSQSFTHIVNPYINTLLETKLNFSFDTLFIRSILCNFIVCIATYIALKIDNEMAKTSIMLLVISTFVIAGFDHCIANIGLYVMGITLGQVDISLLMLNNIFISIVGNIIGGSLMLGIPLYLILKKK
ncbi:nitrite transporter NirC [Enterococcus rotai]|uniref:Formate/nitrite transporter n=1 Tax=Enterococcus rotai TaxID=118060 RepID=A0A0U2ITP3_9ENTE|nr:formate/nitrite transporter family protein [Enterococcus rotai]ALS35694.1 formate/nitrite transporter [Enterococcus rotai]